ncbi:FAST kinase domain-containing protein 4 [Chironomus tepperi]|uniref:FAST kinase domain-containing protein 4 n=1 Tax=Chironomus tepperi TaxID=113505 RepID=UPI00391EE677
MLRHLNRLTAIASARNYAITKNLFASASVLAENKDPGNVIEKSQDLKKHRKNPTVAAVFASLSDTEQPQTVSKDGKIDIDEIILNAKTVNGLLNIADQNKDLTRKHALKIVSILAEWTSIDRAKLPEFENDARFTKLCRMLGRAVKNNNNSSGNINKRLENFRNADLDTVLGVTGDDEAAKLVASITVEQMVKVMKNLSAKKRRSTPLLRSLAFNMSGKEEHLNIKQCSDVLYSIASLNFPEPVLISKLCEDIQLDIKKSEIKKSSTIGSMLTSLAFLKYREPVVLDCLSEWIVKNQSICRTQDIAALCMTLATLNYMPVDFKDSIITKLTPSLTPLDFKNSSDYLSYVWSLMSLNIPDVAAFNNVLNDDFIEKLSSDFKNEIPIPAKIKLLNINGGVKLFMPSYKGAMLTRDKHQNIYSVPLLLNHDKQLLIKAMTDALKNIIPEACLKIHQDTNMGFSVDAEFHIDTNANPIPKETNDSKRIALMVHDYHDFCQGPHQHLSGIAALNSRLLSKAGYEVLSVPHNEFSVNDLLLKRVQYLQKIIKNASKN